ncbi:hypothetical protein GZ77_09230 [Endozoicomonas montiporae]|uniref:Uncharacterized protein n=2 Tax=Endozoicomonas montiporae TaxID=1027273 RepID=A0A081N7U5_9GAMM|nr:hypothetical protein [Endozoicomonas montiporae]AMO55615.1 hypothetical protein EZMO1_1444 [Endozoicomonas montiporae CL-33]KEQ14518.1 hypothetical protein GZ77_09230 [Endozoicomonas montiporae]
MIKLDFHPRFQKQLKKHVPSSLHSKVKDKLKTFVANPQYPSLNFESMTGFPECYTIRVNLYWRIHLRKLEENHYQVFSVETHDAYKNRSLKSRSKKKTH